MKSTFLPLLFMCCVTADMSLAQGVSNTANVGNTSQVSAGRDLGSYNNNTPNINTNNYSGPNTESIGRQKIQETPSLGYDNANLRRDIVVESRRESSSYAVYDRIEGTSYNYKTVSTSSVRTTGNYGAMPLAGTYDNTANSARSTYSSGGAGVARHGGPRYNYAAKNNYHYYTSLLSKYKSQTHHSDTVRMNCRRPLADRYSGYCHLPYYASLHYCARFYNDYLFYEDNSRAEIPVQLRSFDGYLVYGDDTSAGIITMDKNSAYLEQPIDATREYTATVQYNDKNLKSIVLYKGVRELHMTRLRDDDKELWRVLHTGKLSLYDDRYSFPTPGNVHTSRLRVAYAGESTYQDVVNKKELIACINKAYGTALNARQYTWDALLAYIDKLD